MRAQYLEHQAILVGGSGVATRGLDSNVHCLCSGCKGNASDEYLEGHLDEDFRPVGLFRLWKKKADFLANLGSSELLMIALALPPSITDCRSSRLM